MNPQWITAGAAVLGLVGSWVSVVIGLRVRVEIAQSEARQKEWADARFQRRRPPLAMPAPPAGDAA